MRYSFTLPTGSTLNAPRQRCNPGEGYGSMFRRWRKRNAEYRDALVMAECEALTYRSAVQRQFIKAFWGISPMDVVRVLNETREA